MTASPATGPSVPLHAALAPDGWPMRAVRAGIFATSSVALAVGAHRLGGGMQPARDVVLAAAALLFGFGLVWSHRERRGATITAVVLGSQVAAHAAFAFAPTSAGGHRGAAELNRWAAMLLCHNAGHPATAAQVNAARTALGLGPLPVSAPAMHMASPLTTGGAAMLALHLGAAVVMAWWLRRGERAAWTVAHRLVAIVVAAGRRVVPVAGPARASRAVGLVWTPRHWTFGAGLAGRGPPTVTVSVLTA